MSADVAEIFTAQVNRLWDGAKKASLDRLHRESRS